MSRRRSAGGSAKHQPIYLADAILRGIDGCVTTMAVVASVAGAGLPAAVAFVLGLASLVADAFSMGVSNYLAGDFDLNGARRDEADFARDVTPAQQHL